MFKRKKEIETVFVYPPEVSILEKQGFVIVAFEDTTIRFQLPVIGQLICNDSLGCVYVADRWYAIPSHKLREVYNILRLSMYKG